VEQRLIEPPDRSDSAAETVNIDSIDSVFGELIYMGGILILQPDPSAAFVE
jgi:hypothetical protein